MSYTNKQEELLRSLDHIDPDMISGAVRRIDEKKSRIAATKKKTNLFLKLAPAIAACLVLLALALPTATLITEYHEYLPPRFGADGSSAEVETPPEYDGSRGLLYEISEDGTEAFCVGWGACTDEVVYIASHYDGLPVTSVYNKVYWEASFIPADHGYGNKNVKKLVISDTVVWVGGEFIRQCPNIESVYFGAAVERIPSLFFNSGGKNFATVEVSPDNPNFSSKGNCVVDLRTGELVLATPTTIIPDDGSVVMIGRTAFSSARHRLTSIVIPEGVKIIDHSAFLGCENLESITLPDSLEVIGSNAFGTCRSLKIIELGTNLICVDQNAFDVHYYPEIHYKGTVAEWEAVTKSLCSNKAVTAKVICTDGESLTTSGPLSDHRYWPTTPEYEAFLEHYFEVNDSKKYKKYHPYTMPEEVNIEYGT
ncbi:MAG: leucine-rich repeat domain-containing protein [Clostridia bacterium]|nr:leucine-rich repeat domain-containing protein [Clostridia bacterium]